AVQAAVLRAQDVVPLPRRPGPPREAPALDDPEVALAGLVGDVGAAQPLVSEREQHAQRELVRRDPADARPVQLRLEAAARARVEVFLRGLERHLAPDRAF